MLFNNTPHKADIILLNTILRGFVNHNFPELAIKTYTEMIQDYDISPDRFTFPSLLKACTQDPVLTNGRSLHSQILKLGLETDLYTQTALIAMYSAYRDSSSSRKVFDRMEQKKNEIAWTSMINGYARNGSPREALQLFFLMKQEQGLVIDEVTMASAVSACGELRDLNYGKRLHYEIKKSGMRICVVLGTALVDMYSKCGELDLAREIFDMIHDDDKNVVSWSAMISGYSQNNQGNEALRLFKEMVSNSGHKPNEITMMAALSACGQTGDLNLGKWIHAYIDKAHLDHSTGLMNSLVDMYSKCGKIELAFEIFSEMPKKDIISWNVIINGLALHGFGDRALTQFDLMQKARTVPDDITFIGVLSACSHTGLLKEGLFHFQNMKETYRIEPKLEHYGCMVDLLSRAGMLEEAQKLVREMPIEPNGAVWGALLSGCRVYNNVELGEEAAKHLLEIEPNNDGNYVLLSNIYARKKQWEEVRGVRLLMHLRGIRKVPGCSSIVMDGGSHEFTVGDRAHPESEKIYSMLNVVSDRLRAAGYKAETSEVLLNIDEEEKEDSLSQHSEKLALSFGLIKTRPGDEILILKNLRVCRDCHSAFKMISKLFQRKITVRDRSRFHHFRNGTCSCKDYW
ncbi:pentatricopeptide repeat-containing protein At1g08070, chloroplastic-like [Asparagus officinalis]|uniref:pentatricopeptide repeat-containing protein At1g08070, chloroplastic-like n=1 Tax=Asparagus officinalis TaxID=4686 RepID=UPI00098DFB68|nr:pentatricopeptide repeat-containing protein At1g08070, chloroplastic-like [Asparagus officinalis]